MKNYSKFLSLSTIALLLAITTFWACQKDKSDATTSNLQPEITAETIANDAIFREFVIAQNELKGSFAFLDQAKSRDERKKSITEFRRLGQIFNEKGKETPLIEQEKAAKVLGFQSISELNKAIGNLAEKRRKLVEKYPLFKDIQMPANRMVVEKAYNLSKPSLPYMVVFNKKQGTYAVNKALWKSTLNSLTSIQLRCCPSPWDADCDGDGHPECGNNGSCSEGGSCCNAAMTKLQAKFNSCESMMYFESFGCLLGCGSLLECPPCAYVCETACLLLVGNMYASCAAEGEAEYNYDVTQCPGGGC
jgi:hypothetical protein